MQSDRITPVGLGLYCIHIHVPQSAARSAVDAVLDQCDAYSAKEEEFSLRSCPPDSSVTLERAKHDIFADKGLYGLPRNSGSVTYPSVIHPLFADRDPEGIFGKPTPRTRL